MADLVERLRAAERDMVQIMIGPCEERVPDLLGLAADRLTTLEAEAQENARLLGMGGEREAGLHGEIERLKRKVAALEAEASKGERRGLERAAEVADAMPWYRLETPGHVRSNQPKDVAAAIRALIPEQEAGR